MWLDWDEQQRSQAVLRFREKAQEKVAPAELDALLERYEQQLAHRRNRVDGVLCTFNHEKGQLELHHFPSGDCFGRVSLPEGGKQLPSAPPLKLTWMDPMLGRHLENTTLTGVYGLLITPAFCGFYSPAWVQAKNLPASGQWLASLQLGSTGPHFDLFAHSKAHVLLLSCREEGLLMAISLDTGEVLKEFQFRKEPSPHPLNVAFSPDGSQAYITTNTSSSLYFLSLTDLTLKTWKGGDIILGNIAASVEEPYLYMSTLQPEFALNCYDMRTMQPVYNLELGGESACREQRLSQDIFQLTPDFKFLFVVTCGDGGTDPIINVIRSSQVRTVRRFNLTANDAPGMVVVSVENPVLSLRDWTLKKFLTQEGTHKHLLPLLEDEKKAPPVAPKPKKPAIAFDAYQPPPIDPKLWDQVDEEAAEIDLPEEAEDVIADLINWAFYRATLTNLHIHPEAFKKLKTMAKDLRQALRIKKVVKVSLLGVLDQYDFETPLSRASVLEALQHYRRTKRPLKPEEFCPLCKTPMEGKQDPACPDCGFCLDDPDEREFRKNTSAEAGARLFPGQMLLPLAGHGQIVLMNLWREVLQVFDHQDPPLQKLSSVCTLPNLNLLVADKGNHRLVSYSPEGKEVWKARLALRLPCAATWYLSGQDVRYIVVDQGNDRVLEIDPDGKHHRRYPGLKTPENMRLKAPTDVQRTPQDTWLITDAGNRRVLEVGAKGDVVYQLGPDHGLQQPVFARRQANGYTLVVDQGQQAVLDFSPEGEQSLAMPYWPPPAEFGIAAHTPFELAQVIRLHNGELVLISATHYLQLNLRQERIRWAGPLPEVAHLASKRGVAFGIANVSERREAQLSEMGQQLQQFEALAGATPEQLRALAEGLTPVSVEAGKWILREGESGLALYFILEGQVRLTLPDEKEAALMLEAGNICGEQAIVPGNTGDARAGIKAETNVRLFQLDRGTFKKVVLYFPRLHGIVRTLANERQMLLRRFRDRRMEAMSDHLKAKLMATRLRTFPLLKGEKDEVYEAFATAVQAQAYMPELDVFGRGESGGTLYFVGEGSVGIVRKGERRPGVLLSDGSIFGEGSLLTGAPRSSTVRTMGYCKFFTLEQQAFDALMGRFPHLREKLQKLASDRAEQNTQDYHLFRQQAGLDLPRQPRVETWGKPALRKPPLIVFPLAAQNQVVAFEQDGELYWSWGREEEKELFQPLRTWTLPEAVLIVDSGNDRVLEVDYDSREILHIWNSRLRKLQRPLSAFPTASGELLIADEGNARVILLERDGAEQWKYHDLDNLKAPAWAEMTDQGTVLIADPGLHHILEVNLAGEQIWSYGGRGCAGDDPGLLNGPMYCHRLPDGNTLIADTGNHRLLLVNPEGRILREFLGHAEAPIRAPKHCEWLANGDFLVFSAAQDTVTQWTLRDESVWGATLRPTAAAPQQDEQTDERQDLDQLLANPEEALAALKGPDLNSTIVGWDMLEEVLGERPSSLSWQAEPPPPVSSESDGWDILGAALENGGSMDETLMMIPPTLPDGPPPAPSWGFLGDEAGALDETLLIPPSLPDEPPPAPSWSFLGDEAGALDETLLIPPTLPDEPPPAPNWSFLGDEASALDETLLIPPTLPDEPPPAPNWDFLGDLAAPPPAMPDPGNTMIAHGWDLLGAALGATDPPPSEADPSLAEPSLMGESSPLSQPDSGNTMIAHGWDLLGAALGATDSPSSEADPSLAEPSLTDESSPLSQPDSGNTMIAHGWDLLGAALGAATPAQEPLATPDSLAEPESDPHRSALESRVSEHTLMNQGWDVLGAALEGRAMSEAEDTNGAAATDMPLPSSSAPAGQTLISHGWDLLGAALGGLTAPEAGESPIMHADPSNDKPVPQLADGGNTLISHGWDLLGAVLGASDTAPAQASSDDLLPKPDDLSAEPDLLPEEADHKKDTPPSESYDVPSEIQDPRTE